jgi:hypothetical protein
MSCMVPHIRNAQAHLATADIEGTMEHAFGRMFPRYWDTHLCAWPPIAIRERWGSGDNGLVKHKEYSPWPSS